MSLKVTLEETPRVFEVRVGCNTIGKVSSHKYDSDDKTEELYHAYRFTNDNDEVGGTEGVAMGWYGTLREAGEAVVEYEHGPTKINKVVPREY